LVLEIIRGIGTNSPQILVRRHKAIKSSIGLRAPVGAIRGSATPLGATEGPKEMTKEADYQDAMDHPWEDEQTERHLDSDPPLQNEEPQRN